jgi:hypothetical protein
MAINVFQIAAINGKMFSNSGGSDPTRDAGAYASEYPQQPDNINGQLARYMSIYGVWSNVAINASISGPVAGSYSQGNGYNQSTGDFAGNSAWRPNGTYFLRTVGFTDNSVPPTAAGVREGYIGSFQGGHEALNYVHDPNTLSVDYEPLYGHGAGYTWPMHVDQDLPDSGTKVQWRDGANPTGDGSLTVSGTGSVYSRSQYVPPSTFLLWCANNPSGSASLSSGNVQFFFENRPSLMTAGFTPENTSRIDGGTYTAGSAVTGDPSSIGPFTSSPLRGGSYSNVGPNLNNPGEFFQVTGVRKLNSRGLSMHLAKVLDNGSKAYPYMFEEDGFITPNVADRFVPVNVQTEYLWARGQDFAVTSTQVTANVLTVQCVNTLAPGDQVIMNGLGNTTFLNGLMFTVATASPTQFTATFIRSNYGPTSEGQGVASFNQDIRIREDATFTINEEYYGTVADTKCAIWSAKSSMYPFLFFDLADSWTLSVRPRIAGVAVTGVNQGNITNVSETAGNIATITVNNNYQVGQKVLIQGLVNAPFLNTQVLTVLTATPLQFTATDPTSHGTYASTPDTGTSGGYKVWFLSEDGFLAVYDFTQFNGALSLVGSNAPTPAQTFESYSALRPSQDGGTLYALYGTMAADPRLTTNTGAVSPRVGVVKYTVATATWQTLGAASFSPNTGRINGRSLKEMIVTRDGRIALMCEKVQYTNPNVRNSFQSNYQGNNTAGNSCSITNSAMTTGTATFLAVNDFYAGQEVQLSGLTNDGFTAYNLTVVTVLSTGLSGTQFEATIPGGGTIASAAEGSANATPVANNAAWQVMVFDPAGPTWSTAVIDGAGPSSASPRTSGAITSTGVSGNVLTVTCNHTFSPGQTVRISEDISSAGWLAGQTVTIATVIGGGPIFTGFTVNNFPYGNYGPTADGTALVKQGIQYGSNFGLTGGNSQKDYWFYMPSCFLHDVGQNTLLVQGNRTASQMYALDTTPPTAGISNSNLTPIPAYAMWSYKNDNQWQGWDPYVPAGAPGTNPAQDAVSVIHARDHATNADRVAFLMNRLVQFFANSDVPLYVAPPSHNFKSTLASVTSVQITGNVLTCQAVNTFVAGQSISFSGMTSATFLNGTGLNTYPENVTVTVLAAGLSGTQFSANFQHVNYGPTAETTAFAAPYLQRFENNSFGGHINSFAQDKWSIQDLGNNIQGGANDVCLWAMPVHLVDNYMTFVRVAGSGGTLPFPVPGNAVYGALCSQSTGFLPTYYKWSGNGNGVNTAASITQVTVASNLLTILATNTLNAGDRVTFSSVGTATFLNGVTVIVLPTGLSGSQFTATFNYPNYGPTADTGSAQVRWVMADNWADAFTNPYTIPGGSFSAAIPLPYGLQAAFGPAGGDTFSSGPVDQAASRSEFFTYNVAWGNTKFARKARFSWAMFAGQTFLQQDTRTTAQETALSLNFIDTDLSTVAFTAPTNVVGFAPATLGPGASGGQLGWTTQVTWPKVDGLNNPFDASPVIMTMTVSGFDPTTLLNGPVPAIPPTGSAPGPYTWTANGVAYAATASTAQGSFPTYYAFCGCPQTFWKANTTPPGTIGIDLGAAQTVRGYSFRPFYDSTNTLQGCPTSWTLQGSNTGLSGPWTTVDTQSGFAAFARGVGFDVGSPASFRYYQMNITATSGGNVPALGMLQLFSAVKQTTMNFTDLTFMSFGNNNGGGGVVANAPLYIAPASYMSRGYKFEVSTNGGGLYTQIFPLWRAHLGYAYSFTRQVAVTNLRITCQQGWNYSTNPFNSGGLSNPLTAAFGPVYLFDYGSQAALDAARLGSSTAANATPPRGSFDPQCIGVAGDAITVVLDGGSAQAFTPDFPDGQGGNVFNTFSTNQYYAALGFWSMNPVPPPLSGVSAFKIHPFFGFLLFQGAGPSGGVGVQSGTNLSLTYQWGRRV